MQGQARGKIINNGPIGHRAPFQISVFPPGVNIDVSRFTEIPYPQMTSTPFKQGDTILWLTGSKQLGYMVGTIISIVPSVNALFQDNETREVKVGDVDYFNIDPVEVVYRYKDTVIADIFNSSKFIGTVQEVYETYCIVADTVGTMYDIPKRHMVIYGPGFDIPEVDNFYNS